MSSVAQTITLPVCDASELKNGDIKDFEFGEGEKKGKVFLAKVDDKVVRDFPTVRRCGPVTERLSPDSSLLLLTARTTAHHW
jgi:hypothetical protein